MIYLAGPYTDKDSEAMELRYLLLSQIAAHFLNHGEMVFSPITHGHALEQSSPIKNIPYHRWIAHGLWALQKSDRMYVCELPGVDVSTGVNIEIEYAAVFEKPYEFISPDRIKAMDEVDNDLYDRLEKIVEERNVAN